jgi:hypothetical protein
MRSKACRLRRLWRVTSGGGPADTVGLDTRSGFDNGRAGLWTARRDGANLSL